MQQWKKRGTYHSVLEAIQEMSGLKKFPVCRGWLQK